MRGIALAPVNYRRLEAAARLAAALRALEVDWALSEPQLERHYALSPEALAARSGGRVAVLEGPRARYAAFLPALRDLRPDHLAHLAGTAEIRHRLGARPEDWRVLSHLEQPVSEPDAVWRHPRLGHVAIEFDQGAYRPPRLERKIRDYARLYAGQVWGTPNPRRAEDLERRLVRRGARGLVLRVAWP